MKIVYNVWSKFDPSDPDSLRLLDQFSEEQEIPCYVFANRKFTVDGVSVSGILDGVAIGTVAVFVDYECDIP